MWLPIARANCGRPRGAYTYIENSERWIANYCATVRGEKWHGNVQGVSHLYVYAAVRTLTIKHWERVYREAIHS
jgi:hypothetical protein